MKPPIIARLLAAAIVVAGFAAFSQLYKVHQEQIGREAFLADQAQRYDRVLAHPSLAASIVGAAGTFILVFFIYEILAFGISKLFPRGNPGNDNRS